MSAAKCSATTKAGTRCTRFALPGTERCGLHPPAHGDGQPRLEDGTVDVRALCKRWDEDANRHAGKPRD